MGVQPKRGRGVRKLNVSLLDDKRTLWDFRLLCRVEDLRPGYRGHTEWWANNCLLSGGL